jgi:hypothetical protein
MFSIGPSSVCRSAPLLTAQLIAGSVGERRSASAFYLYYCMIDLFLCLMAGAFFIDPLNQLINDRALRKRHEPDRGAEGDFSAGDASIPESEGDSGRTRESRVTHIDNRGQGNTIFPSFVLDNQFIARVPDLIHEIKYEFFHEKTAKDGYGYRHKNCR